MSSIVPPPGLIADKLPWRVDDCLHVPKQFGGNAVAALSQAVQGRLQEAEAARVGCSPLSPSLWAAVRLSAAPRPLQEGRRWCAQSLNRIPKSR